MSEFFSFKTHPGHLFVVATVLPLLSFFILLLFNGLRSWLRRRPGFDPEGTELINQVFNFLGGDRQNLGGALVSTGAIFLSFCLSLTGFIIFLNDPAAGHHHAGGHGSHHEVEPSRWKGSVAWANLSATAFYKTGQKLQPQTAPESGKKHEPDAHADKDHADKGHAHLKEKIIPAESNLPDPEQGMSLRLGYNIDHLSGLMFVMVTLIATLIHLFSMGYMSDERQEVVEDHEVHTDHGHLHRRGRFTRFFTFLSLFCFSMLNLILADNLFQVFLSWELVGICSYLLISHYYERQSASNAANKAFITNRIGDAGFIIGLLILWTYLGTLNFEEMFQRLRSPLADSHSSEKKPLQYAGQIVYGEVVTPDDPKQAETEARAGKKRIKIHQPGDTINLDTQAVLFPRILPGHFHGAGPGGDATVTAYAHPAIKKDSHGEDYGQYGYMPYWTLVLAGLGIFLGCMGKSAQFPLHVWLPDAMEGPTPVSALIHAATMVAAGVYLVGRCFPLFTGEVLLAIAYTGAITLFVAATIAVVMTDIKKVLAYSTVSQLGYMMLGLGIGGWVAGLFHLITHAFFKALLFLGSGSVIYGCHHVQDMNRMGGLYPKMKITAITMLIGVLAICGIPLFSGWYSKDAILAHSFGHSVIYPIHFLLGLLPMLTAGLTAFYMFRMWLMTFAGKPKDEHVYEHAHESPWLMTMPLIVLAFFSVVVAWGFPQIWDPENSWLEHQLHHSQPVSVIADMGDFEIGERHEFGADDLPKFEEKTPRYQAHENHGLAGLIALGIVLMGISFAFALYYYKLLDPAEAKDQFAGLHNFLTNKWRFDELYSAVLVRPALVIAQWCRAFDTYVIDGVIHFVARMAIWISWLSGRADHYVVDGLANGIARVTNRAGTYLRNVQTGYLRSYILFLVLAAIGIWLLLSLVAGIAPAAR